MVVIVLVSILAAVSLSIMKGRVDAAKWAEAKAGAGTIAKAFVSYASEKRQNGTYPPTLTQLGFTYSDLHGTYFVFDDYSIPSASYTPGANPELTYIIQVDKPTLTPSRITLDNSGNWTESNP